MGVFEAETLLAGALAKPGAKEWVCDHILSERRVGVNASKVAREWIDTADAALVAEFLIGGITRVTLFPQVVYGARTWAIRPGGSATA